MCSYWTEFIASCSCLWPKSFVVAVDPRQDASPRLRKNMSMRPDSRTAVRRTPVQWSFMALAFLAISLVLARPICDAFGFGAALATPGHQAAIAFHGPDHRTHDADSSACCASIEDEAPLSA